MRSCQYPRSIVTWQGFDYHAEGLDSDISTANKIPYVKNIPTNYGVEYSYQFEMSDQMLFLLLYEGH